MKLWIPFKRLWSKCYWSRNCWMIFKCLIVKHTHTNTHTHTLPRESSYVIASYWGINISKSIITNSPPGIVDADLHSALSCTLLQIVTASHKSQVTITAVPTGCWDGYREENTILHTWLYSSNILDIHTYVIVTTHIIMQEKIPTDMGLDGNHPLYCFPHILDIHT